MVERKRQLRGASLKIQVLEERRRLQRIQKYGPGSGMLSDTQLEWLELEPGGAGCLNGILQADGYAAYDHVAGPKLVHAACWTPARRKFCEAHQVRSTGASTAGQRPVGPPGRVKNPPTPS